MKNQNSLVWDSYYKKNSNILIYPDENLVRIIEKKYCREWQYALDFGCGSARHIKYLKHKKIPYLYGIDFSKEIIQKNKKRFPEIQFIYYNNEESLPFENNQFDLILAWGVLHYNSKDIRQKLLGEFFRLLKKDGLFIGTYRAKQDTHFKYSDVSESKIYFFDEKEIYTELSTFFKEIELGYMERSPLGKLNQRIAHYFFCCKKI